METQKNNAMRLRVVETEKNRNLRWRGAGRGYLDYLIRCPESLMALGSIGSKLNLFRRYSFISSSFSEEYVSYLVHVRGI